MAAKKAIKKAATRKVIDPEHATKVLHSALTTATAPVEREFVTVQMAETISGISLWSWRKKAYTGEVASTKFGSRLLIPVSEIQRVLSERARPRVTRDPITREDFLRDVERVVDRLMAQNHPPPAA